MTSVVTIATSLAALVFMALWIAERIHHLAARERAVDDATRQHRIALAYIARQQPDEAAWFVELHLAGNRAAIARHFPGFAAFEKRETADDIRRAQLGYGNG